MRGEKEPFNHPEFGMVNTEFRSRSTDVRGRIFIYASQTFTDDEREAAIDYGLDFDSLPRGVIVGTVELVGCDEGDWFVKNPQRADELRKPARRANPVWFYPFDEDVPRK
jgi:hypothetical protein